MDRISQLDSERNSVVTVWTRYPPSGLHARLKYIVNDMKVDEVHCGLNKKIRIERGTPAIHHSSICSGPLILWIGELERINSFALVMIQS